MNKNQKYTAPECKLRNGFAPETPFLASGTMLEPIKDNDDIIEWDD